MTQEQIDAIRAYRQQQDEDLFKIGMAINDEEDERKIEMLRRIYDGIEGAWFAIGEVMKILGISEEE